MQQHAHWCAQVEKRVRAEVRALRFDPMHDGTQVLSIIERIGADVVIGSCGTHEEQPSVASDVAAVVTAVHHSICGFGPLQPFFDDDTVEEIWINEPGRVFIALADVLGARSAAQSAVREASRVYSRDISSISGEYRARQAAQIAFADRHLDLPEESLTCHCSLGGCLEPGSRIRADLEWDMPLPWLPATFHSFVHVPIAASQEFVVDNYRPSGAR